MATRTLRTPPLHPSTGPICGEAYLAADVGTVLWDGSRARPTPRC